MWQTLGLVLVLSVSCLAREKLRPVDLNEDNWQDMLEGEWMVKL